MFTIYGGKTEFNQWDQGQRVTNPRMVVGDRAVFRNASGETHPMIAYNYNGVVVADVPNDLLRVAMPILVDLCETAEYRTSFQVIAQDKPDGYEEIDNTPCIPKETSGGVSSWNDLTDKPFGETIVQGDTMTWDGNTEGRVVVDLTEQMGVPIRYVHISDTVPTLADFVNGSVETSLVDGELNTIELTSEEISSRHTGNAIALDSFSVVLVDNAMVDVDVLGITIIFPKAGVYASEVDTSSLGGMKVQSYSLQIPGYTGFTKTEIKPIDTKYLPGAVVLYADDGLTRLYSSADTSNESNRTTLAELKDMVLAGRVISVLCGGFIYCMATNFIDMSDYGALVISMEGVATMLYTAEYTGS